MPNLVNNKTKWLCTFLSICDAGHLILTQHDKSTSMLVTRFIAYFRCLTQVMFEFSSSFAISKTYNRGRNHGTFYTKLNINLNLMEKSCSTMRNYLFCLFSNDEILFRHCREKIILITGTWLKSYLGSPVHFLSLTIAGMVIFFG